MEIFTTRQNVDSYNLPFSIWGGADSTRRQIVFFILYFLNPHTEVFGT